MNKDILDLVTSLDYRYDLILLIDVLEHWKKRGFKSTKNTSKKQQLSFNSYT